MIKKRIFLISFFIGICSISNAQDAIYKIEFISNWNSSTHPNDYPSGSAHWSPLIGTTHKDGAAFLELGSIASDGVEEVAETGGTGIITQELNTLISSGLAYSIINGSGLGSGPGTITVNDVNVDSDFPNISLLTMIAPSPDWIASISNFKLTDASDNWIPSISVDVYATDVGTDNGSTYTSNNEDTNPRTTIRTLQNVSPFSNHIVGTFTFTLQQVLAVSQSVLENSFSVYPNPNKGTITIKNSSTIILESAEVYTVSGQKIAEYNKFDNQQNLKLLHLPGGLYFLKLNADKGSITKKIVVQ